LTCSKDAGYMIYRSTSVLFQQFFEHEFICRLDRRDFLPWQMEVKASRYAKIYKYTRIDPDSMYLVKIVPRRNLFQYIVPDNLVSFWFFVKQHFNSRKNRVIPMLE
jgi:dimethyladenosine transferase 2, mitochondrial